MKFDRLCFFFKVTFDKFRRLDLSLNKRILMKADVSQSNVMKQLTVRTGLEERNGNGPNPRVTAQLGFFSDRLV